MTTYLDCQGVIRVVTWWSRVTDLALFSSIVVESVGLVVGAQTLSDSQLDVYRTAVVLLNLCQTIKFAGNFVFYVRLRDNQCGGGSRRRSTTDGSGMALYRFRTFDEAARSTRLTEHEQARVTSARRPTEMTASYTWPDGLQFFPTARTVASV